MKWENFSLPIDVIFCTEQGYWVSSFHGESICKYGFYYITDLKSYILLELFSTSTCISMYLDVFPWNMRLLLLISFSFFVPCPALWRTCSHSPSMLCSSVSWTGLLVLQPQRGFCRGLIICPFQKKNICAFQKSMLPHLRRGNTNVFV